jgi:hypothetical protein
MSILPRDSHVTEPKEIHRLSEQCQRVLKALQARPQTRRELLAYTLNVTARISDLRKAGYNVQPIAKDGNLVTYGLRPKEETPVLRGHSLNDWGLR